MKRHFLLAFVFTFAFAAFCFAQEATPAPSPAASPKPKPAMSKQQIEKQLIKYENELWEAWKNKNSKPFQTRLWSDGITLSEMGVSTKAETVKAISAENCAVKSYKLSDFKTVMLDSSSAVLTYKGTQDATCGGTQVPATVWASSTYVRRGGKWLAATHQETPVR